MRHQVTGKARAHEFIWAAGIENTFVPQTRNGTRPLDEFELIGHYRHWREDLGLAGDLGLNAVRWGAPWYKIEPQPGKFDWRWTDKVIPFIVEELKINLANTVISSPVRARMESLRSGQRRLRTRSQLVGIRLKRA